jgi:hypothetical protein
MNNRGLLLPEYKKGGLMKKFAVFTLLIFYLSVGCATMAENSRMEKFGLIAEAYERALRMSDYDKAAKFVDPSAGTSTPGIDKLKNFKIVDYEITHIDVSESKQQVTQDVELHYFRLNSNILHTAHHPQTWRFKQEGKIWLLQTGLPELGP